jgi:NADH-quinone oxidoreductase subunit M
VLALDLSFKEQIWLFAAFGLAFAIKVPIFPLHTWLPDAHTEAPTAGSVILAGILLKVGTYGFLRFAFPLFPSAVGYFSLPMMSLAVFGIVYGAFLAYAQTDVKKLVAYSSVSHLGFVVLGMFALTEAAVEGSIIQMVNHGISTGGLFLCVGILYERRHTRAIADFGGIAKQLPIFTVFFMIMTLSSIGLPGTNGFVGEFTILVGTFAEAFGAHMLPQGPGFAGTIEWLTSWRLSVTILAVIATLGVVLGAIYMLSMFRRVMFGPIVHEENKNLKDLSLREGLYLFPLAVLVFAIGFFPEAFMSKMHRSVDAYVAAVRPAVTEVRSPETAERDRLRALRTAAADAKNPVHLPAAPGAARLPGGAR